MCKYCGTNKHRKIYENHFGSIPKDDIGRTYEIHHIDNNHKNNDPINLKAVTIQEHYDIHYKQSDYAACLRMSARMKISPKEKSILASLSNLNHVNDGTHHWLKQNGGSERARQKNIKRFTDPAQRELARIHANTQVKNRTHNFLGGEIQRKLTKKRIENRTHNFYDEKLQRKLKELNRKRIINGIHQFQIKITCPHCGKIGSEVNMKRWHFDNCKLINPKANQIICPHCNKIGKGPIMKRYHFDNCKFYKT